MHKRQAAASSIQGVGLGLRPDHFSTIETQRPAINWFEVLADNYFNEGGVPQYHLSQIAEKYPLAQHSVGMNLGGVDPLDWAYFEKIKHLSSLIDAKIISDHLCFVAQGGSYFHDLLPLPYTEEALNHVVSRISQVQDFLGRQIAIENVSSYLNYKASTMQEWEFLAAVSEQADCQLLLDINNIYVSAMNHGFSAETYWKHLPKARVKQFHLAGFQAYDHYLLDTHGAEVDDHVWKLYQQVLTYFGPVPTLVEWDNDIPQFDVLLQQAKQAHTIMEETCHEIA